MRIIKNKKGVIEMMETFMILFVIFILIGFGMYFFYKISSSSGQETHTDICITQSTGMLSSIVKMPDIQCNGKEAEACIDIAKLAAFSEGIKADKNRRKAIESSVCPKRITVEQAYPYPDLERKSNITNCTRMDLNNPDFPKNCGKWNVFEPATAKNAKASRLISTPVSLYYPTKDEYGIGRLVITLYTTT